MSTEKPDEEAIRALFEEAYGSHSPPPFERLWPASGAAAPHSNAERRPRGLQPRFALGTRFALAATLVLVLAGGLILAWNLTSSGKRQHAIGESPLVAEMAAVTSSLDGPLDFLLRTPGYDFLETVPGSSTALGTDYSEIFTDTFEETLP